MFVHDSICIDQLILGSAVSSVLAQRKTGVTHAMCRAGRDSDPRQGFVHTGMTKFDHKQVVEG